MVLNIFLHTYLPFELSSLVSCLVKSFARFLVWISVFLLFSFSVLDLLPDIF